MRPLMVATVVGVLLGGLAGGLAPLPAPAIQEVWIDPGKTTATVRTEGAPCPDLRAEVQQELDDAWADRDAAEIALLEAEDDLDGFLGEAGTFDGYDEPLTPEALETTVDRLLADAPARLQWVDCAEAPCIAVLELTGPDREELVGMRAAAASLQDGLGVDLGFEWVGFGERAFLTVPLGPAGLETSLEHRVDVREEALLAELVDGARP